MLSAEFAKEESVRPKDGRPPPRRQILYADVAPLVGLDPHHPSFHNFPVFYLNQSRIPTGLLKSIVQEMDVLQFQHSPIHGPDPDEHNACEQFSRMLSPVSLSVFRALEPRYLNILACTRFSLASQVALAAFSKPH